jgi:uncharacterized protein
VVALLSTPVLLVGGGVGGSILGNLLLGPLRAGGPVLAEVAFELRNIISFALMGLLLAAWLRWYERRPLWTIGLERRPLVRPLLTGWLLSVILAAAAIGLSALLGGGTIVPNLSPLGGLTAIALSLLIIPSRFVQGGVEELIFRGWMLPALSVRYRPWIAVLASSVIFSLLHVANAGFLPLATLNIGLFGVFVALYALREGGVWGVVALHAGFNWAQVNLFGLPSSGHTVGATLLDVRLAGSELIAGGAFGIENSLPMTAVMLAAVAVELALAARRASRATPALLASA